MQGVSIPTLTTHWDSAVKRDTWPAVSSEMVFATDRDALVCHTSEVVSPLCVDHMVSGPSLCLQRDMFTEQRQ